MGVGIGREGERWRLIGGLPGQAKVLAGGFQGSIHKKSGWSTLHMLRHDLTFSPGDRGKHHCAFSQTVCASMPAHTCVCVCLIKCARAYILTSKCLSFRGQCSL